MDDLSLYFPIIGSHWLGFMLAFPFIIDEAIKWLYPRGREWLAEHLKKPGTIALPRQPLPF